MKYVEFKEHEEYRKDRKRDKRQRIWVRCQYMKKSDDQRKEGADEQMHIIQLL